MKYLILHILFFISFSLNGQSLNALLQDCQSKDPVKVNKAVKQLQQFKIKEFDVNAQNKLASALKTQSFHLDQIIMLAGFLQLQEPLQQLSEMEIKNKNTEKAIKLALVRSGDAALLKNLLRNAKKIEINDDFVYQVAPLLSYVRQKETTDYLLQLIQSSPKNCSPADAETNGTISCAYRLVELVAPTIKDFPVQLKKSGDLDVDDYPKALEMVKNWIKNNPQYQLKNDVY